MLNKILVALDTSETCTHIFDQALALAQATGANLTLLRVLTPGGGYGMSLPYAPGITGYPMTINVTAWETYQKECKAYKERGWEILSSWCSQATAKGVRAEFDQVSGEPGRVICDRAKTDNSDLIIVGSHGRSGLSEFLIGSVSSYVMHRAACSVMVVRRTAPLLLPEEARETSQVSAA
ncbi:MAG: universal stress protein [Phormidesmis sp.]